MAGPAHGVLLGRRQTLTRSDTILDDVAPDDPRIAAHGLAELVLDKGWWQPCRLPVATRRLFVEPSLEAAARACAGARLGFVTDADALELAVDAAADAAPFDVVIDGGVARPASVAEGLLRLENLGHASKRIEIWLPHHGVIRLGKLRLSNASQLQRPNDRRPHWVVYGSSITQCRQAAAPTQTWPALVARQNDWNLTCLGFGGECHLDHAVARHIGSLAPAAVTLELGINIYGQSSHSVRSLASATVGFIEQIRDAHPRVPMTVITPVASPEREAKANAVGLTLERVREEVRRAVRFLQEDGDCELHMIDGLEIIGVTEGRLLGDGLHPSAEGYRVMARRLAPRLAQLGR